ncbi:MAG: DEAD/DEAH box helicase [Candidatus Staskawiczbacteria bacterium RIFOXYB2_FULL_32_9]|uniref:DEAD/DEAH box helicase n=1 Tax=Candidatus Staskawiczbacteria bacterium RIFOXYD1_FULL_32_13 TaxID=1802234 RepID=A0A1G2JM83_9BACT|nr:MAG: DEAD/DEAH box helicase [Candidatus Staskawiczbacteria bacterium RIFOXYA2_FULL_32_7]OGZ84002.1 MAG: DEAD/DEAH box helicase [Candidatus Staskawiczbacteria bacterium RIFOXYB2_FULL_32_9]OGZ87103.1 MAG: DEAD/DEAH box helicase [Candidatus Staskawiczbacteria bacterium RIFOXYC2_FULL_32_10]OGZ88229.1 MAG: DEAD/DEAH box helicase [Candidatus Staskawiczbacteria bacterium RIFOXYD1_FULL_32_13]
MKITGYHASYFTHELTKRCASDSLEKLSSTLSNAQVDLNPHQIEAALFAFKSPLSKGAILADEVGLGKTIEAGLVLSQKWAERKRNILLIVPSSLRKQWNEELQEKFFLPSVILEAKSFNQIIKDGNLNPFNQDNTIIICSYHFAKAKSAYIKQTKFSLCVIDEAHRLRNVYKTSNKIAREIKDAIQEYPKLLLTATPLQNSLLELYGLTSIIDDHIFGDLNSFKANYAKVSREQDIFENELGLVEPKKEMFADLRNRLKPVCIRTLRRQVLEYINYRDRKPITQDYIPTEQEIELYNGMSEYLQRPQLYALPYSQRQLMTLVLRKLLASSSFAIASTLNGLVFKLEKLEEEIKKESTAINNELPLGLEENYEALSNTADEWIDDEEKDEDEKVKENKGYTVKDIPLIQAEKKDLEKFRDLAKNIFKNSKGDSLLIALKKGFEMTADLGAQKKAVIFTESTITQKYLWDLLSESGYKDKIMLFNGSNNDQKSKDIYIQWREKNKDSDRITGSKTADLRSALVDYFKSDAEIMIATEAAAEGINLQFCSLVINYDLPWNPQRIEQRIGRCHRYGQKHDVVVVNFVNRKNAADQRVYELLDQKFKLFKGVFGASDEVLGSIESGVDFEKRIATIYQSCRTEEEINSEFDKLQTEMDESIQEGIKNAKEKLLENFDADVHEKLKINLRESKAYLETYEKWLWDISQYFLGENAVYAKDEYSFTLKQNPFPEEAIDEGPYKIGKYVENAHIYRPGHPLAERILKEVKKVNLVNAELIFDYSKYGQIISPLKELVGTSGILKVSEFTIDSFESEDSVLVTAITDDGNEIEEDIAKKLFILNADISKNEIEIKDDILNEKEKEKIKIITVDVTERNSEFFNDEVDKLDKWAEDVKKSLELELRKMDIDIKTMKTNAKKILNLEEKVKAQRGIKDLEKKRNDMRQKLYQAQDEVDVKKDDLLDRIESQLNQKVSLKTLFTIHFKII